MGSEFPHELSLYAPRPLTRYNIGVYAILAEQFVASIVIGVLNFSAPDSQSCLAPLMHQLPLEANLKHAVSQSWPSTWACSYFFENRQVDILNILQIPSFGATLVGILCILTAVLQAWGFWGVFKVRVLFHLFRSAGPHEASPL